MGGSGNGSGTARERGWRAGRKPGRRRKKNGNIFQKVPRPCLHSGLAYTPVGGDLETRPCHALSRPHPQDPSGVPGLRLAGTCSSCGGASSTTTTLRTNMIMGRSDPRGESAAEYVWEPSWRRLGGRPGHGCAMRCLLRNPCTAHLPSVVRDPLSLRTHSMGAPAGPPR